MSNLSELPKEEKELHFRKLFYQKWGTYQNYLKHKPPKKLKRKSKFILKVSQGICPECHQICEVIIKRFRNTDDWFPIGFNCKCGFKQKAAAGSKNILTSNLL